MVYEADLQAIARRSEEKTEENDAFLRWIHQERADDLDELVHSINDKVSAAVDCTTCGNCCKTLVINVTTEEAAGLGNTLGITAEQAKEQYIEESLQGNMYINTMPCHFLTDNKCTIYTDRFTECREFPHLHKPGFKARLLGTLGHYGRCPIIYNVIEEVKVRVGFLGTAGA
jgi:Fe-S-cluster containining protein